MYWRDLPTEQFELLCARLLQAADYRLEAKTPRSRDVGVDFLVTDRTGRRFVVEVKQIRSGAPAVHQVRRAASQAAAARDFLGTSGALLMLSVPTPEITRDEIEARFGVQILDAIWLDRLLANTPDLEAELLGLVPGLFCSPAEDQGTALEGRATELIERLAGTKRGKETWREFEEVGVEIINYALIPPFRVPRLQSRTEDGLDVRDAVYPISDGHRFWDSVKRECRTRFAVAEFKNYSEAPGQAAVESIQQYLFDKAMRTFGILCARLPPASSALAARRRSWLEFGKLIVIFSDEDLNDLVQLRGSGKDTSVVIDGHLDDFFSDLTPESCATKRAHAA